MPALHIHLLGDFLVLADGRPVAGLHQARLQSLLAYLLLHRHAPQSRQYLAFLFWPDSTEKQARTNLRKTLYHLRDSLPDIDLFLQSDANTVQWRPDAPFTLDVMDFEEGLSRAVIAKQNEQLDDIVANLTEAANLYKGEFLPSCYDDWVLAERERLHQCVLVALEQLMQQLEDARDYAAAVRHGRRLLTLDPVHEATYRRLMRLHLLNGDRAGALRVYHRCSEVLERELDVTPNRNTQELYTRLLQQNVLETPSIPTPQRTGSTRLVGRESEWRHLQAAWDVASTMYPQFELVAGEAGIGKTRLVEEMRDWARQQGIITVHTRAFEAAGGLAYAPVIDWMRSEPFQMAIMQLDRIWRSELARLLPELLVQDPDLPRPEPLTEHWQRQRLFEALTRVLLLVKSPMLLALDDLQWCDAETLEWLHFMLHFMKEQANLGRAQTHVLVIGTVRPEEIDADHPLTRLLLGLRRTGQVTEIQLSPLNDEETVRLATQVTERELNTNTALLLYQITEGNPLFIMEMISAENWSMETKESSNLTNIQSSDSDFTPLPPKVYAVIQSRITQLSPSTRELATLAAVIGRSFTFDLLSQASNLDEKTLVQGLDELWRRRIIREQGSNLYDFSHDLIREVMYKEVSPIRRRMFHKQTARALAFLHAKDIDTISGQLGFHYEQMLQWEEAIQYYRRAANVSTTLYAFESTLFYLDKMLSLLQLFSLSANSTHHQIEILLETAQTLIITKGWTAKERRLALEQALKLAREVGDEKLLLDILIGLYGYYANIGDWNTCHNVCAESIPLAEKLEYPVSLLRANIQRADLYLNSGEFQSSLRYHRRTVLIEEQFGAHYQFGSGWQTRMAEALWFCGYPEEAQRVVHKTICMTDEQGHPHARIHGRGYAIYVYHRIGYPSIVNQLANETDELCEQFGFTNYALASRLFAGWVKVQIGLTEEGLHQMSKALDEMGQIGDRFCLPYHLAVLAEAQTKSGRTVDALNTLAQALNVVEDTGDRLWEAEVYRLTGEVRFRLGHTDADVETLYELALNTAQRQSAKSLELRAAMSLASIWQSQGKSTEAHALLAPIYNWFTEGFDTPDLRNAKELLESLASVN